MLHDAREELETAVAWAAARSRERPRTRIALVVPDLERQLDSVQQIVHSAYAGPDARAPDDLPIGLRFAPSLGDQPLVGAALCGLELSSPRATFATLSRWLRSPFFHGEDATGQTRAATLEASLRQNVAAQLSFLAAYERGGLARRFAQDAPALGVRLDEGLRALRAPGPKATPDVWARAWTQGLAQLGWPTVAAAAADVALRAWDATLTAFAELTPVVGRLSQEKALEQLRILVEAPAAAPPLPLHGLHVLAHIDDVGPGYDAVWVTGLTDQSWPEPARTNPLLPRQLQALHGMPGSTPADALARAEAAMARLLARTAEVVLSAPSVVQDYRIAPSPLLAAIEHSTALEAQLAARRRARAAPTRALERRADPAPALAGQRLEGGARALDWQARCPIRGFCETRLHARALEPPAQGLSPRIQGIAVHRALELFVGLRPTREAMHADHVRASDDIRQCVERALAEIFGRARAVLQTLFDLETRRIRALLERFLDAERRRPPFNAVHLEERTEIKVGDYRIGCRIDRIDALPDGTLVLIDYKTGASAPAADWFGDPLTATQLPLYSLDLASKLGAILTLSVQEDEAAYRGVATRPEQIAPTLRALPEQRSWAQQVELWRLQIRALVEDYARGDVRVYADDCAAAQGAYAPLTRVYAHPGLQRAPVDV
jgi:probable DNA repair protein